MKKKTVLALAVGLCTGCIHDSVVETTPASVAHNYELNTTEINANGDAWDLVLPPKYKVLSHSVMGGVELMYVKSKYNLGGRAIVASIRATNDADKVAGAVNGSISDFGTTFEPTFGPEEANISEKQGTIIAGIVNDATLLVQFTTSLKNTSYVLVCTGSPNAQIRVGHECLDLLERFQPK